MANKEGGAKLIVDIIQWQPATDQTSHDLITVHGLLSNFERFS